MLEFDTTSRAEVDLAKRTVPDGAALGVDHLLRAVHQDTDLHARLPKLAGYIPRPEPVRPPAPEHVPTAESLKPILGKLHRPNQVTSVDQLFATLVDSEAGRLLLRGRGATDDQLDKALSSIEEGSGELTGRLKEVTSRPGHGWRDSVERRKAVEALRPFGRLLTETELPNRSFAARETAFDLSSAFCGGWGAATLSSWASRAPGRGRSCTSW